MNPEAIWKWKWEKVILWEKVVSWETIVLWEKVISWDKVILWEKVVLWKSEKSDGLWCCVCGDIFSCSDNSSYRLNTLGPLCLWQCFGDNCPKTKSLKVNDGNFWLVCEVLCTVCKLHSVIHICAMHCVLCTAVLFCALCKTVLSIVCFVQLCCFVHCSRLCFVQ